MNGWVLGLTQAITHSRTRNIRDLIRVRRHFRLEAKWSETEAKFFSLRCEKSAFFACFASMRNVEIWSETKMERKSENKTKKSKKLPSFSLWSEMKRKGSKNCHPFRFEVKWSKKEAKNCHHFRFEAKWKQIFFASMQKNEMKRKQYEKEAKTSKRKRIEWNSGTICKESKKNMKAGLLLFYVYT